jgi:hypothetical protein
VKRLWLLLAVAAAARLLMQCAALPPYAGLDEAYHVARFAFVAQEGRNPRSDEKSIPPYVARSIAAQPGFAAAWPARSDAYADRRLTAEDLRPYTAPNYEAQHPSLNYAIAGRLMPRTTQLEELRFLRLAAVFFAWITVLATAFIGARVAGAYGILAGALLVMIPTWETLVLRASNDAFACAAIAVAFAISFTAPKTQRGWIIEALAWALALATKLYAWPASVGVFALWFAQRAPWKRRFTVMGAGAIAVFATLAELATRTRNPLGLFMFDPGAATAAAATPIRWAEMAKITVASFAWTSGSHWNALRPLAIVLYLVPVIVLLLFALRGSRPLLAVCLVAAIAFAVAQLANVYAYARVATDGLPAGGKEGWYWYTLAPLWFGVLVALALKHAPRAVALFAVAWIVGWDVLITEGALFQDYAGITSAPRGDALFRWGGRAVPFTYSLGHAAVGPLTGIVTELRVICVAALAGLAALSSRDARP